MVAAASADTASAAAEASTGADAIPLVDLIAAAPLPSDADRARLRLADWRVTLSAESRLTGWLERPRVAELLSAIADQSSYLWRLASLDVAQVERLLAEPPGVSLQASLHALTHEVERAASMAEAMRRLRVEKSKVALLVALADLGGVWGFDRIVDALTRFADAAVASALRFLLREADRTGRLRLDPLKVEPGCGITVLALGKGGGGELNYSSDIDLVVLFDAKASGLAPEIAAAPFYVRLTQHLVRMLGERTQDGFVLRVDLRLRPDPASTAVALSLPAAFSYYESYGQNWERAAFIKARPIAGDLALGAGFLADLAPFLWRKYFDYGAIADIHAMKRQIHAVRGHAEIVVPGHDVKVGRGGIREIEFFVQTQQLIFGGRRPRLRGSGTLAMLAELHADGWVSADAAEELAAAYRFLRRIEHRLQMVADEQTQRLPQDGAALKAFARWAGFPTYEAFAGSIVVQMRAVERHYARLFEHAPGLDVEAGSLVFTGVAADAETVATLSRLGFRRPAEAVETVRGWHFGRRPAVQSSRAREVLTDLVPALLSAFAGSGDPDGALSAFDDLLARLPAAVELFSMLKANAALRQLFADILGLAPRLAATVARRPHVLDAAIDPALVHGRGVAGLRPRLGPELETEDFLDRARDIAQEDMFAIGVRLLAGTDDTARTGAAYSELASGIVAATLAQARRGFERDHGRVPGASCVVVGMGRLGSHEMTATSDLDLLLIYDVDPADPESDGVRRLDASRYFTRLTQRLIANLTVTTRRGRLYDVDMRLRPSGNQGPLATRLSSFVAYQTAGADLWEHMALTRARILAGDAALAAMVEDAVRATLVRPRTDAIRRPIAELRALVAEAKGEPEPWDLKLMPGGMLDIDFMAQFLVLRHASRHPGLLVRGASEILAVAGDLALLPAKTADALIDDYRLYAALQQIMRVTVAGRFDPAAVGGGLVRRLTAVANLPDLATLERDLEVRQRRVRAEFESMLGPVVPASR